MAKKNPYDIIKHQHVTEKSVMLENLKDADSNPSVRRCKSPKYVFIVAKDANKQQIAEAVEEIYSEKSVKVVAVNTINVKSKKRRVRGRIGVKPGFKKAVVTLDEKDRLDDLV